MTTTHLKQGWLRRNGVPESDQTTMIEHFVRHDRILTHVAIISDPVYLAEPLDPVHGFRDRERRQRDLAVAVRIRRRDLRPAPRVRCRTTCRARTTSFRSSWIAPGAPAAAARGGPETIYPGTSPP